MKWLDNTIINSDLLMYGLLIGTLSLVSFGVYFYFNNKINNNLDLANITQTSPNNLDSDSTESIISNDTVTQDLTHNTQITDRIDEVIGLLKAEGPNLYHLSDEALKDRILNILYGLCSDTDELTEVPTISKSVFNALIEQDPGRRDFLGNMHNWVDTLPSNSSVTTNNLLFENLDAQIEKLILAVKDIKLTYNDNPNDIINTFFGINNEFMLKLYHLINQNNHLIDYITLNNIMTSSSLPLIDSNLQVYANLITNMLI